MVFSGLLSRLEFEANEAQSLKIEARLSSTLLFLAAGQQPRK